MRETMPPEVETAIHRAVADLPQPFTRSVALRRAGDRVIAGAGAHFVLKSALSLVPEQVFHDARDLADAIGARWDEVRQFVY